MGIHSLTLIISTRSETGDRGLTQKVKISQWTTRFFIREVVMRKCSLSSEHSRIKSKILNTSLDHSFPECGKDSGGPLFP